MKYKHITRTMPIGKQVVDTIYVHCLVAARVIASGAIPKKYWYEASSLINRGRDFTILKYSKIANTMSFIYSSDFDTSDEPSIESVVTVNLTTKKVTKRTYNPDNCPIYHHKWLMVGDNYTGFDVEAAKLRSRLIIDIMNAGYDIDRCRIGFKKYWNNVPLILDIGKESAVC